MNYEIRMKIHDRETFNFELAGDILVTELIELMKTEYPDLLLTVDQLQTISIRSQALQKYLEPQQSISCQLGQIYRDEFTWSKNNLYAVNSEIKITFEYKKQKSKPILFPNYTSFEQLYKFGINLFSIQEQQVGMMYNGVDLLQHGYLRLEQIIKENEALIKFITSESTIIQEQLFEIQIQIIDGTIVRAFKCKINQFQCLNELKQPILNFIGIQSDDVADVDFFIANISYNGPKLQKTFQQLHINQQDAVIQAKIRWTGGKSKSLI